MANINSTRRGFSYQDKYALMQVLVAIRDGVLDSFVTDKPFHTKKSVDIEILLKDGRAQVYEVKTGNTFKLGKWGKLGQALRSLYDYWKLPENSGRNMEFYLAINPGLESSIRYQWSLLTFIKDTTNNARYSDGIKTMQQVVAECKVGLKFDAGAYQLTDQEFTEFVKKITFKCEFPDEIVGVRTAYTTIMDQIHIEIEKIATQVNSGAGNTLVTSHSIALQLLELIVMSSEGRGLDVKGVLDILIDCFAIRRSVDIVKVSGSTDDLISNQRAIVKGEIHKMMGIPETPTALGVSELESEITTI